MFKYNDIKDTNVIFTNLFISYVIITTLLNNFVIKPFFIDKIQPSEDVSQLLKTYFFNNYNEIRLKAQKLLESLEEDKGRFIFKCNFNHFWI